MDSVRSIVAYFSREGEARVFIRNLVQGAQSSSSIVDFSMTYSSNIALRACTKSWPIFWTVHLERTNTNVLYESWKCERDRSVGGIRDRCVSLLQCPRVKCSEGNSAGSSADRERSSTINIRMLLIFIFSLQWLLR